MLYIVGLGPGAGEGMTLAAHRALSRCGAIVGYSAYIDLLEGLYPEARRVSTGMMREVERCRAALELLLEESKSRQILLFTCQHRESAYLSGRDGVTFLSL